MIAISYIGVVFLSRLVVFKENVAAAPVDRHFHDVLGLVLVVPLRLVHGIGAGQRAAQRSQL